MTFKAIFRTLGDAAVILSQWCTIQAFVQATMWHNTEPKTLGVSIWATSLFASACFHGIFCSFIYTICNLMRIRKSRMDVLHSMLTFCGQTLPAVFLAVSSLPTMDTKPEGRTVLLYCGVFATQLHIILRLQACERQTKEQIIARCDPQKNRKFFALNSGGVIGCDAVTAALFTMGLRWCYWGVNALYEYWQMSLVLAGIVALHSCTRVLCDKEFSWKKNTIITFFLTKFKQTRSEAYQGTEAKNGLNHPLKGTRDDSYSNDSSDSFLDKKRHGSTHFQYDVELIGQNTIHSLDCKTDGSMMSVRDHDRCCSKKSCLDGFFCYVIVAPAIGSLGYLFLWIFTSPTILRLWGQFQNNWCGYLVFISFAVGCCFSVMLNLENLTRAWIVSHCTNNNAGAQKRISKRPRYFLMTVVILLMLGGCSLILFTNHVFFYLGAGCLSVSAPALLRILLTMSYELLTYEVHPDISRNIVKSWRISGFLLVAATTFSIHHIVAVMFINPRVITIFHGNMQNVLYPLVIFTTLPVLLNPLFYMKFNFYERPTSPLPGPLLESPLSEMSPDFSDLKVIPPNRLNAHTRTRLYKVCFAFLIVVFSVMISLTKSDLLIPYSNCQISRNMSFGNDSQGHIRVISWNILLGHTYTGRNNLNSVAKFANEYKPDFLALQEATGHPPYWGGKDIFGFLEAKTNVCRESGNRVSPMNGSLEVGILSTLPIISSEAKILPNLNVKKLPTYTMAKITSRVPMYKKTDGGELAIVNFTKIHVYAVHAAYKNWTCNRETKLSCAQMKVLYDDIKNIKDTEPVILVGDFNANPSEPELDMWFDGRLGFKSALWPDRPGREFFNYTCESEPTWDDQTCDCECRNLSSDPPHTTLLNRNASVDHIFYRGLKLNTATILNTVGPVSDHYPVMADFSLES